MAIKLTWFSTGGIMIFIALSLYASTLYPGKIPADFSHVGYDWVNDYWCDLIWPTTEDGAYNPASPWAIGANFILCFSFIIFFINFSIHLSYNNVLKWTTIVCGSICMLSSMVIFTDHHDWAINLSVLFGIPAVVGIILGLIRNRKKRQLLSGFAVLAILAFNVAVYYSNFLIEHLPVFQKIGFACVLGWVISLNFVLKSDLLSIGNYDSKF